MLSFHESIDISGTFIVVLMLVALAYTISRRKLVEFGLERASASMLMGITLLVYSQLDYLQIQKLFPDTYFATEFATRLDTIFFICGTGLITLTFVHILGKTIPTLMQRFHEERYANKQAQKQIGELKSSHDENISMIDSLKKELGSVIENQYRREISGSQSIELYRKIFDKSPVFYIALSDKNEIDDINAFACERLGYSFAELVSSRFLDIVVPDERNRVDHLLSNLHSENKALPTFETEFRDRNRESIAVTISVHSISRGKNNTKYLFCEDVSKSRALSESLAYQAAHDELTQLCNRRALEAFFSEHLSGFASNTKVALIYFDVDQLKVVNDTCGHTAGDQLLKQIVAILKSTCDEKADVFARIGGDEFAIVKTNCHRDEAVMLAEELRNAAEDFTFSWEGKSFRQSISVGVATGTTTTSNLNELLSAADAACYTAKENGRNQVRVHEVDDVNTSLDHRQGMLWVSRLDKAIKQGDFSLSFQPIIQLDRPHSPYIHYEVLVQYVDELGNSIPPGNFLPSAERFGKSTDIDLWVMTETFDFLRRNPDHTERLRCCSINLTSHSIANHRSRSAIISLVKTRDFPASKICFEITETSAIRNLPEAIDFIQTLRALGCRFALDDFGTGFSSFGYLKNLEVDYLKIDGSFVKDIVDDNIDKAMIRAISEVAQEMGIKTVAEYVENEKILRELRKVGVNLGQGYGIAKPMPMDALHEFYHYSRKSVVS